MSLTKRHYMPELYELIDGVKACEHANFNEYFEKCDDCNMSIDEMPQEMQDMWNAYNEGLTPEQYVERAEQIRDSKREDGENV